MTDVKMSMAQVRQRKGRVNQEVLERISEADVRRHASEDDVDVDDVSEDWWPSPRAIRTRMHKTQEEIAQVFKIPIGTWLNWEQGRVVPDPASRALLRIAYLAPEVVLTALMKKPEDALA